MNFYPHHIGDFAEATAHLTFIEDAAYSRLIRKYYATEKPLIADIKAIQRLVGCRTKEDREAVQTVLAEFFSLEEDGWHNKRCDEEIEVYQAGAPERAAKRANQEDRLKRHRQEKAQLCEALRSVRVHVKWDTPIAQLRALHAQHCNAPATPPATLQDHSPATATATPVTATHTQSQSHPHSPVPEKKKERESASRKTPIPPDFGISTRVREWAKDKGHNHLDLQLEAFVSYAKRAGAKYVDWDEALMNAIREDWAKVRGKSGDLHELFARGGA